MLFSLPRKRGINIAKIRGNKVTDYRCCLMRQRATNWFARSPRSGRFGSCRTRNARSGDYVLPFLIGEDFYWLDYWAEDDTWSTNDDAGKYFTLS